MAIYMMNVLVKAECTLNALLPEFKASLSKFYYEFKEKAIDDSIVKIRVTYLTSDSIMHAVKANYFENVKINIDDSAKINLEKLDENSIFDYFFSDNNESESSKEKIMKVSRKDFENNHDLLIDACARYFYEKNKKACKIVA